MKIPASNNFGILRLVLATLVLLGHTITLRGPEDTNGVFGYTDFAVDAFFIVSGYLIYASFELKPVLGSFYIRRFFRIYPLYFFMICLQGIMMAILLGGISSHMGELVRYLLPNFAMANFFAHDMGRLFNGQYNDGINPSLWTLKIEAAFYLILPFLWLLTRRGGGWFLVALYLASSFYVALCWGYSDETIAKQLPGQLRFFVIGMALYRYHEHRLLQFSKSAAALLVVGLVALCTYRFELPVFPFYLLTYPLCVGLIVYLCSFRLPVVPLKIDISYGVYLIHGPLLQLMILYGWFEPTIGCEATLLITVYILALIAERCIERPSIALGKRLSQRWQQRHAPISEGSL